ncbi:MAG TPA: methyltransferase [Planktothrix sp.]|jgi:hypothetical protein
MSTKAPAQATLVNPGKILQTALAFWHSKALLSAAELDLFTILAQRPHTAAELNGKLKLNGRGSRDLFDALVSMDLLQRDGDQYRNSPDSDYFLDAAKPSYIGGFLQMTNARLYPTWGALTQALRTGKPQNESANAEDTFAELYADKDRLKQFLSAMTGISTPIAQVIAEKFNWSKYKTFTDVGTAQGALPIELVRRHEHLHGVGFDLPQCEPIFDEYARANNQQARLKFACGDFFKDDIPSSDVITLGHILHDWDMNQKTLLIEKVYKALPAGGSILIYDAMIDPERKHNTFGLLMSLNMLVETQGGFDYTSDDCASWLSAAGFNQIEVTQLTPGHSMCTGIK